MENVEQQMSEEEEEESFKNKYYELVAMHW